MHSNVFIQLIRELHAATTATNDDDQSQRGTQLLEIYALEIQMYNETRNVKKLKVSSSHKSLSDLSDLASRKSITPVMLSALPSPIQGLWGLSKSAVVKCGWENVRSIVLCS